MENYRHTGKGKQSKGRKSFMHKGSREVKRQKQQNHLYPQHN